MLSNIFEEALEEFFNEEAKNILSGVSERNLCSRLAIHLERIAHKNELKDYYADTEYNRKQNGKVKTILDDEMEVVNIVCDLILHSRGEQIKEDNLIAIEMKKSDRLEEEKESDRVRLKALTKSSSDEVWSYDGEAHPEHVCGYKLGYFLEIDLEEINYTVEKYKKGKLIDKSTSSFCL